MIKYNNNENKQFPPDILKAHRLFGIIKAFAPSHVLELGCGTSSFIISKYLLGEGNISKGLTVDRSSEWLSITKERISTVLMQNAMNHVFYEHRNNKETIQTCKDFISLSDSLLIYLDGEIIEGDEMNGLQLILDFCSEVPIEFGLLIDSRKKAYKNLNKLATSLGRNLDVTSSVLFSKKENVDETTAKARESIKAFQLMNTFTYVCT